MSVFSYPNIVNDSLVLTIDAGNQNSYAGSGTNWYDLSGNGNNGTLTNGPTFNSSNIGSIVFDGIDDYINIPNSTTLNPTQNFTLSCWVNIVSFNNIYIGIVDKYNGGNNSGFALFIPNVSGIQKFRFLNNATSYSEVTATSSISTGVWYNVATTYDGSNINIYVNGVFESSASCTGNNFLTSDPIKLGGDGVSTYFLNFKLSTLLLYNRALTSSEILQNYNSIKYRYGL
jgi:hypothetical protein